MYYKIIANSFLETTRLFTAALSAITSKKLKPDWYDLFPYAPLGPHDTSAEKGEMKKETAENPNVTISVLFRIKEGLKKLPPNSVGTVYVAGDVGKIALQVAKDLNIIQDIKKEIIAGRPAGLHKFSNGLVFATVTGIHPTGLLNSHFKPETQRRQDVSLKQPRLWLKWKFSYYLS